MQTLTDHAPSDISFAIETFGGSLDLDMTCRMAGEAFVRYADENWHGWLPLADIRRACDAQAEIEASARRSAVADVDLDDEDRHLREDSRAWQNSCRRWQWQLLHDRIGGTEDASDPWAAVFGRMTEEDVRVEAGDDISGYVAAAVGAAREQGAGLPPDVVEQLLEEYGRLTEDA